MNLSSKVKKISGNELGRIPGMEVPAFFILAGMISFMLYRGCTLLNRYGEYRSGIPKVHKTGEEYIVDASSRLFGYFPLRGHDLNKDGQLDYVERFYHGAPRIPFVYWKRINGDNPLFTTVQEEYERYFVLIFNASNGN